MKPFDDKFADNVREAFDAYQEPVDEKAWEEMQQRLIREKKPRIFLLPPYTAWAAAAAVLILVGALLWLYPFSSSVYQENSHISAIMENRETTSEKSEIEAKADELRITAPKEDEYNEVPRSPITVAESKIPVVNEEITIIPELLTKETLDLALEIAPEQEELLPLETPTNLVTLPESPQTFYTDYQPDLPSPRTGSSWQIAAGPALSYTHSQVADGMGFAAGIINEWNVTEKISVSAGGILTYNQFGFNPEKTADYSTHERQSSLPEIPGFNDSFGMNGNTHYSFYNKYQFTALDFPLNITWRSAGKSGNGLLVTAGLSSLVYLQENFTENSSVIFKGYFLDSTSRSRSYSDVTFNNSVSEEEHVEAFNRFDFARLLNLSLGYEFQFNKNAFVVEPFVKLPLGNMTSRDIQMGMGGITLKYHLNTR